MQLFITVAGYILSGDDWFKSLNKIQKIVVKLREEARERKRERFADHCLSAWHTTHRGHGIDKDVVIDFARCLPCTLLAHVSACIYKYIVL